ncbi:hypothetical protein BS333_07355 [Vibrio azureus]|uniref:Lysozyme inhibitor LprI-like N-terminal domain-containing protein n=1 Tax=Vibrio azureus NBRC 104587 TaxID=1219077 RepID=U3C935_9VIBR|nr:lysozyme inhibitor LprI family protein [Vibrio azureus]AUI86220.1 hypothetical protein BS333_07355 [Vibrio azureus]GAD77869.1 hypothetical protein VAZ01S_096_00210 [Vibrio azureus NBRC 104587]
MNTFRYIFKVSYIHLASFGLLIFPLLSFANEGENTIDCREPSTTLEINQCAEQDLAFAQVQLNQYLKVTYDLNVNEPELVSAIQEAQTAWQDYMLAHCGAVYKQWQGGTIRGVMALSCKTKLTQQRTHDIWTSFLTYMDNSAPVLPEPALDKTN